MRSPLPWLAAGYFLLQVASNGLNGYGYFIDELYYIACSKRLDFGYVDHPPLTPLILRLVRAVLGESQLAIRTLPAAAGAATVYLAGLMARRMGGGRFAEACAALSVAIAPVLLVLFGIFTVNAFDILLWSAALFIVLELLRTGRPRLWIAFGVVAGIAMQNKHTFLLLAAALGLGLLFTPERRLLRGRWVWLGTLAALALAFPNLIWQLRHDWISLEFYKNATLIKNLSTHPLRALFDQILSLHPATLPVWVCGLYFLLRDREGKPYRALGWMFVILLVNMVGSGLSRPDRIAPVYPVLFAAGAVLIERKTSPAPSRGSAAQQPPGSLLLEWMHQAWVRPAFFACLALAGMALAPLALPVLSPQGLQRYTAALGITPQLEKGKPGQFPQWFADRFGWEELADTVAEVHRRLPAEERERAALAGNNYGASGALEFFGPSRGLPGRVIGTHNNYWLWGPGEGPVEVLIAAGSERSDLEAIFGEVEQAAVRECGYCYDHSMPIYVARRPRLSVQEVWPQIREFH